MKTKTNVYIMESGIACQYCIDDELVEEQIGDSVAKVDEKYVCQKCIDLLGFRTHNRKIIIPIPVERALKI
jgi:hypothetical protein